MLSKAVADQKLGTQRMHKMLLDVVDHARKEVMETEEPRARALLETSAEVLVGLAKAYEDYDSGNEPAWRR